MQKRSLKELINTEDPSWPLVQEWIATAHNQVEGRASAGTSSRVRANFINLYSSYVKLGGSLICILLLISVFSCPVSSDCLAE